MIATALFKPAYIDEVSKDRYGRTVAIILLKNGENLQDALLKEGFAWVWPRYCRGCHEWEQLQNDAQMARRGVWANNDDSVPPWDWRRGVRASKLQ